MFVKLEWMENGFYYQFSKNLYFIRDYGLKYKNNRK